MVAQLRLRCERASSRLFSMRIPDLVQYCICIVSYITSLWCCWCSFTHLLFSYGESFCQTKTLCIEYSELKTEYFFIFVLFYSALYLFLFIVVVVDMCSEWSIESVCVFRFLSLFFYAYSSFFNRLCWSLYCRLLPLLSPTMGHCVCNSLKYKNK